MGAHHAVFSTCPCCGAPFRASARIKIIQRDRLIIRNGKSAQLTPTEMKIFNVIYSTPDALDRYKLVDLVYADDPNGGPEHTHSCESMLTLIRRKLFPLGLTIKRYRVVIST
jgi:hypothetical protein